MANHGFAAPTGPGRYPGHQSIHSIGLLIPHHPIFDSTLRPMSPLPPVKLYTSAFTPGLSIPPTIPPQPQVPLNPPPYDSYHPPRGLPMPPSYPLPPRGPTMPVLFDLYPPATSRAYNSALVPTPLRGPIMPPSYDPYPPPSRGPFVRRSHNRPQCSTRSMFKFLLDGTH